MSARLPRLLALGAATATALAALAWIVRGPAIMLDIAWIAACF